MIAAFEPAVVERFRGVVSRRLGLSIEDARLPQLADVLRRRVEMTGHDCEGYIVRLAQEPSRDELSSLSQELTVTETYFFRNIEQFAAFRELVLPDRMRARQEQRRLRILSAGCASGEEAYTLAICAREAVTDPSWDVAVRALDINPAMLEKAESARYSTWVLRETPAEAQRRWFRPEGREVLLAESIRSAVDFERRNLAEDDPGFWGSEAYDVVFCRNVLMYFTPEGARGLVARLTRSLAPGGYLFLGHAETLRGLSRDFHLRHTHGTFYYQLKDGSERLATPAPGASWPEARTEARAPAPFPNVPEIGDSWIETIRRAADRIRTLTEARLPAAGATLPPPAGAPRASWDLAGAFDLLRQERFAAALDLVRSFPEESGRDPDVVLLHAILLAHKGPLAAAEEMCRRLLEVDELSAGAHYLLALCREGAGEIHAAVEHDRIAVYLDPGFAMPRLHLGLLARRAGDVPAARRELLAARALLQSEETSRLLLFGGGFPREALVALCDAELQSGGRTA